MDLRVRIFGQVLFSKVKNESLTSSGVSTLPSGISCNFQSYHLNNSGG